MECEQDGIAVATEAQRVRAQLNSRERSKDVEFDGLVSDRDREAARFNRSLFVQADEAVVVRRQRPRQPAEFARLQEHLVEPLQQFHLQRSKNAAVTIQHVELSAAHLRSYRAVVIGEEQQRRLATCARACVRDRDIDLNRS